MLTSEMLRSSSSSVSFKSSTRSRQPQPRASSTRSFRGKGRKQPQRPPSSSFASTSASASRLSSSAFSARTSSTSDGGSVRSSHPAEANLAPPPSFLSVSPAVAAAAAPSAEFADFSLAYPTLPTPTADLRGLTTEQRDLFLYYRQRIDAFESERVDFIQRLHSVIRQQPQAASDADGSGRIADLNWQLSGLQRQLSDAKVQLHQERRRALAAQADAMHMRVESLEDRKRISQLLAITQETRDSRAAFITRNLPQQQRRPASASSVLSQPRDENRAPHSDQSAGNSGMLGSRPSLAKRRTAAAAGGRSHWPEESVAVLQRSLAELREHRSAESAGYELQVNALLSERKRREKEHAQELSMLRSAASRCRDQADELRSLFQSTTLDYMQTRHAAQRNERTQTERIASLSQQLLQMQEMAKAIQLQLSQRRPASGGSDSKGQQPSRTDRSTSPRPRSAVGRGSSSFSSVAGSQLGRTDGLGRVQRQRGVSDDRIIEYYAGDMHDLLHHCAAVEKELRAVRQAHEELQAAAASGSAVTASEVSKWKARLRRCEERRRLELEGFQTDVRRLRDEMRGMEECILRLDIARRRERRRRERAEAAAWVTAAEAEPEAAIAEAEALDAVDDEADDGSDAVYLLECQRVDDALQAMQRSLTDFAHRVQRSRALDGDTD